MRILITNDDGIDAPGLATLTGIATELAGEAGEVWTVAPAREQSGVGHAISFVNPMRIEQRGPRSYAVDGTPADCVLAGLTHVMTDAPDLILSGVNRGNNSAENALYSGTLGAAIEGALQGIPSFALSQYLGPRNAKIADPFEAAEKHGASCLRAILDAAPRDAAPYPLFYNINFPPVPASDVTGIRVVPQGRREGGGFGTTPANSPTMRQYLWVKGSDQQAQTRADTDAAVNLAGAISVTPMRGDLTDYAALDALKGIE